MSLLQLRKLNKHFGGLHVTNAVDLTLEPGEIQRQILARQAAAV